MKIIKRAFKIFFADAKNSYERAFCLVSALFWTWLEFSFIKFMLRYAMGMYYAVHEQYPASLQLIIETSSFARILTIVLVIIIFLTRVPLHKKKQIKVKGTVEEKKEYRYIITNKKEGDIK